jgi:acyl homoserine lactone synthase
MQIVVISNPQNQLETQLVNDHHRLRANVFAGRLGWDVSVADGTEIDWFDDLKPTYILAVTDDSRVVACARLLPALGPTMLTQVFPRLVDPGKFRPHTAMVESSRFCVDTQMRENQTEGLVHQATLLMFAGIVEWSIASGISEIVTVTDLRFERILARVNWPLQRLGHPQKIGVTMAVAGILPADGPTLTSLRELHSRSRIGPASHAA